MYAELTVLLKSQMDSDTIKRSLGNNLGKAAIEAKDAVANNHLKGYVDQVVGAITLPNGVLVIYLHFRSEIIIYIYGINIHQIKNECEKSLRQLSGGSPIAYTEVSAKILISVGSTDVDILVGEEFSWMSSFYDSFKEKFLAKVLPSALTAGLVIYNFVPSSPPVATAIIALSATIVGVVAESIFSAFSKESWKWKESK